MENITEVKRDLPQEYRVINIENVDGYLFIETNEKSLIIDKNKNVYDVGDYKRAYNIFKMGDDLVGVLGKERQEFLVNLETKEVYCQQRKSYCSGIFKTDDDYVHFLGDEYDKMLFNIRTKEFVHPEVDLPVKFFMKIGPGLFMYEYNDYEKSIYLHYVIDKDGKVVHECGRSFPYFEDGNLILSSLRDSEVTIVHDVLLGKSKIETLSKNGTVSSNPLVHTIKNKADYICFVSGKDFLMVDANMNVKKKFSLDIEYDDVEIQLWGDIAVIIVKKGEESYCIALNLNNGVQIKHQGIWVLPLDIPGPVVIRGCDSLGDERLMFTIYDENGVEYTHHEAKDCFNVHCKKMNIIRFYGVKGVDGCIVYNVTTKEEKTVPWVNPEFKTDGSEYMPYGFGIRYGKTRDEDTIDLFDEDFNIVYEGIVAKEFQIRGEDFAYEINNNLLLLTVPVSNGPATYYRKIVFHNGKKIYDSFSGYLSFVGNFLQVIDTEEDNTYYIDSRSGEVINDMSITENVLALPDRINIDGKEIKLVKRKVENTRE